MHENKLDLPVTPITCCPIRKLTIQTARFLMILKRQLFTIEINRSEPYTYRIYMARRVAAISISRVSKLLKEKRPVPAESLEQSFPRQNAAVGRVS